MTMPVYDSVTRASAVFEVLVRIPAARDDLATIAAHDECDRQLRKRTYQFDRKLDSRHLFEQRDADELLDILVSAERWRDAGISIAWVSDDHCADGGWYERTRSEDAASLEGPCTRLRSLFNAMQLVRNVIEAEEIADRLAV